MIDLHTHSTASDGTLSPSELVELAAKTGLRAIALTDHDTTSGLEEAIKAGKEHGIEVIPGCELSVSSPVGVDWMHLVGLWVPKEAPELQAAFKWLIDQREVRNRQIVEKLRKVGINTTYERIADRAGGTIGRPHFALELLEQGVCRTPQEVFDKYLGANGMAYVPKAKLSPEKALEIYRKEGITSILAHPFALRVSDPVLEKTLKDLKDKGLDGMEVYYTEHNEKQTKSYHEMCQRLGLLESGGSDFHGKVKPRTKLGIGRGGLRVRYELLETMKEYRRAKGLPA